MMWTKTWRKKKLKSNVQSPLSPYKYNISLNSYRLHSYHITPNFCLYLRHCVYREK